MVILAIDDEKLALANLVSELQKVFVGDFVEFTNGAIEKILPRKNYILHNHLLIHK